MPSELIISWVSAAVAVFTAIIMAIKAFRTTPGERADVAAKYEQMAERQANQITALRQRIDTLETSLQQVEEQFSDYMDSTEKKFNEWQHGVALLIHQIESHGDKPLWKPKDTGELKK